MLMVVVGQRVRVGDFCKIGNPLGTIEKHRVSLDPSLNLGPRLADDSQRSSRLNDDRERHLAGADSGLMGSRLPLRPAGSRRKEAMTMILHINRTQMAGRRRTAGVVLTLMIGITSAIWSKSACAQDADQVSFGTPEEAAQELAHACETDDVARLLAILGPPGHMLISSGDEVADKASRQLLARAFQDKHRLVPEGEKKQILYLGVEDWPVPVPIVRREGVWQFDTMEGRQELLRRRVGGNESSAISICRLYVEMQNQYAQRFYDRNTFAGLYAQKFMSDPGKHNGLYWEVKGLGERSPADALVQLATQEGYTGPGRSPRPFHGYYFRILTAQGQDAPGGAKSYFDRSDIGYFAERKMTGGFALVAYPAKYQVSGVLSFIVNQDGIVYQKDLGEETQDVAREMTEYNPDSTWVRVY